MNAAHTPGPWEVFHDHPHGGHTALQMGYIRPAGTKYDGREIATVHLCATEPGQAENARLIAAAPEEHASLLELRHHIVWDSEDSVLTRDEFDAMLARADAAIAKATSGSASSADEVQA